MKNKTLGIFIEYGTKSSLHPISMLEYTHDGKLNILVYRVTTIIIRHDLLCGTSSILLKDPVESKASHDAPLY